MSPTILVPPLEEVPRISDAEWPELLASLEESRAEYAAGNCHVLKPGILRTEFDAIVANPDISDNELDALLGIGDQKAPDSR